MISEALKSNSKLTELYLLSDGVIIKKKGIEETIEEKKEERKRDC